MNVEVILEVWGMYQD